MFLRNWTVKTAAVSELGVHVLKTGVIRFAPKSWYPTKREHTGLHMNLQGCDSNSLPCPENEDNVHTRARLQRRPQHAASASSKRTFETKDREWKEKAGNKNEGQESEKERME
jgi:hypothetical protein